MNMKKLFIPLLCASLLLTSCSSMFSQSSPNDADADGEASGVEYEENAERVSADTVYMNEYLGVSFTVPAGWWLYEVIADNFSETAGETADAASLDISRYDEGDDYIYMISFANLQYSTRDNHIGVELEAEKVEGADTLAEFIEFHEAYMLEPFDDGMAYSLVDSSQTVIGGTDFERRIYEIPQEGAPYKMVALTCAADNGYFVTILATYWDANVDALDSIDDLVEARFVLS